MEALSPQHFQASLQLGTLLWFFMQEAIRAWELSLALLIHRGFRCKPGSMSRVITT